MGQRTHFVIVAEDKYKKVARVTVLYHHWGIGRNMPIALMSLVGNIRGYDKYRTKSNFIDYATVDFEHLGFIKEKELNYIKGVAVDEKNPIQNFSDWRDAETAGNYMRNFDNNNGCMFIFVTYNFNKKTYDETKKAEIAWMIGFEDAYTYLNSVDGRKYERNVENKKLGGAYEKWLTTRQWMSLDINADWWDKDPEFKELFNRFLAYFDIKPLTKPRKARNAA